MTTEKVIPPFPRILTAIGHLIKLASVVLFLVILIISGSYGANDSLPEILMSFENHTAFLRNVLGVYFILFIVIPLLFVVLALVMNSRKRYETGFWKISTNEIGWFFVSVIGLGIILVLVTVNYKELATGVMTFWAFSRTQNSYQQFASLMPVWLIWFFGGAVFVFDVLGEVLPNWGELNAENGRFIKLFMGLLILGYLGVGIAFLLAGGWGLFNFFFL